ncbi:xanthine dehydrogenase [Harmonia axyridis]|uniref:xanthine dehydrogenase n=1 Tax=Harmonia axyridis TaxID=115357 RepID=UPI001E2780C0|nr:xanthine dehydrogenase [Harmonia axyridis]
MIDQFKGVNTLVFFVNGKKVVDNNVDPEWTLLYYLRTKLDLCGTKLGCGEGGCGACTVMVSKYDRKKKKEIHLPVNACLAPVCAMHGLAVTTVEGIGSTKTRLHAVQERIAKAHGSQCGFCTPGIVMSMYTLLRNKPSPNMNDLEIAFQGNLCRCTGYRPIIEGFRTFTEEWERAQGASKISEMNRTCGMGDKCCKLQNGNGCSNGTNGHSDSIGGNGEYKTNGKDKRNGEDKTNGEDKRNGEDKTNEEAKTNGEVETNGENKTNGYQNKHQLNVSNDLLYRPTEFIPHHPTQEPIFPPELKLSDKYDKEFLLIQGKNCTWYRPTRLQELLLLKSKFPTAKIVVGNSEVGVEMKFKNMVYPVLIQPSLIEELVEIKNVENGVKVGAGATLIDIEAYLREQIECLPAEKTRLYSTVIKILKFFAGKQIRSVGSLGSNIMTGSPISDMIPVMMAANVTLQLQSIESSRTVHLNNNFFTGYRKSIVDPNEVLVSITIPYSKPDQYFYAHKQARRREDDIAIVNMCMNVTFQTKTNIISDISLAFGGMSFKTLMAVQTAKHLKGLLWNRQTVEIAFKHLLEDLPLDPSAPGGMIQYRRSLTLSLFFKGFLNISKQIQDKVPSVELLTSELSATEDFHSENFRSSQYFHIVPNTDNKNDALRKPIVHNSAFKQSTGEAVYCDDMPRFHNELYMAFVLSTEANAIITSIDTTEALATEGVHEFISAKDIAKDRLYVGTIVHDEKVFYTDEVTSQGQIIGAIVADDQIIARKATKKVKVTYEKRQPVIITIDDAIKQNSYLSSVPHKTIKKGDVEKVFAEAPHTLEGECKMGGQEHFYLETQAVIAVPKHEDNEMELYSSSQNPTELCKLVAFVLGLQQHKVIAKVKRLGGGFGGKESKSCLIGIPAAVAASKLKRPVRTMLDRDEDMIMTGGRHPFQMKYKVAFDDQGKILGCKIKIYCNAGYSMDLSPSLLERAMTHFENAYYIPVVHVEGYVCKTNLPSNTAFRGFGGPQGMYVGETIIREIAEFLQKDVVELSELNLYKEGDLTHYNMKLVNCAVRKCWYECLDSSNYHSRRKDVDLFNKRNRYKKRGLSIVPTKFGIAFTATFLNQGGALVLVYTDGSVLISHGGTEMGQGLYIKTLQVASSALGIPISDIHISETSTDKVPNTSPTAASTGSDLNGMAVLDACNSITERLKPYKEANPDGTWKDWIRSAYYDRVCLSAVGFCKTPDIGYDWDKGEGNLFNYFTHGAACSEVEIDTLTGDHQVLRTDIVMDVGESINPAIDIGQIEGAFMQGYGLFVLEEMTYSPTGMTFTRGPGTYKIPGFGDIPLEFNVSLLKGATNPRAVYSSKAVGEPPLFLASSVLFAIKDAIKAARISNGFSSSFKLNSPATAAKIRMACEDVITSKLKLPDPGSFKPWNIEV